MEISSKLIRQFLVWLIIGITVYAIAVAISDTDNMLATLARIGITGWLLVLGLSTLNIILRFIRWQGYLTKLGHKIPVIQSLEYFVAGFAFTSTPAKAGEAVRSLYLKRDGVSYTNSLAALFVERLTDLIAVVLLALGAAYTFEDYRWLVVLAGCMTLAMLPLVHSRVLQDLLTGLAARIKHEKIQTALIHLVELIRSSAALLRSGPLYGGMLLSMLAAFAVSFMMYTVLILMGVDISMPLAVGIYATGILAGALSFLPGGIGSAELVMIGLLTLAGVDITTATAATLVCRVAAMWYSIVLGIGIVLRLEFRADPARENS